MPEKTLKQRLADGQTARVMMLGALASPKMVELAALGANVHGVWIDQEHVAIPHPQLEVLLMACRSVGFDAFVRVPPLDYVTIMRPMEAGACGIMVAQIRTVEQVREIVQWAKYPPVGMRGLFRGNYEAHFGLVNQSEHIETCNRDRWLVIQIETTEAVACVDQIVAVKGVDSLFVGPGDLAAALGVPGQAMHPRCIEALERVSAAVKKAGKSWGVLPANVEHAERCRDLGCQLFSLTTDVESFRRGLEVMKQTYRGFF